MPIFPSSSRVGSGGGSGDPPIANPDLFTIPLGGPEFILDVLENDNLRGELLSTVVLTVFTSGLEGMVDDIDADNNVIYTPPTTGGPRTTVFEYTVTGIGGISNGGERTLVTINLTVPLISTIYAAGIYAPGVYE